MGRAQLPGTFQTFFALPLPKTSLLTGVAASLLTPGGPLGVAAISALGRVASSYVNANKSVAPYQHFDSRGGAIHYAEDDIKISNTYNYNTSTGYVKTSQHREMPYRKRYYRTGKRYYGRRKRYYRKRRYPTAPKYGWGGKQMRQQVRYGQKKFADLRGIVNSTQFPASGKTTIVGTWDFQPVCKIPRGSEPFARIGNRVLLTNVHIGLSVTMPSFSSANYVNSIVKLVLVLDRQNNGGSDITTNSLYAVSGSGGVIATDDVLTLRNLYTSRRYKILKEMTITLNPQAVWNGTNFDVVGQTHLWEMMIKKPIMLEYNDASGSYSELTQNAVYLGWIKDDNTASMLALNVNTNVSFSRVRFVDMNR